MQEGMPRPTAERGPKWSGSWRVLLLILEGFLWGWRPLGGQEADGGGEAQGCRCGHPEKVGLNHTSEVE